MEDFVVRSLGHGVYRVSAPDSSSARVAMGQIGKVLEVWSDPEDPGSHAAVMETGFPTSKWEASIAVDPEVAASVRRSASCSGPDSRIRFAIVLVSAACAEIFGETYDASTLTP